MFTQYKWDVLRFTHVVLVRCCRIYFRLFQFQYYPYDVLCVFIILLFRRCFVFIYIFLSTYLHFITILFSISLFRIFILVLVHRFFFIFLCFPFYIIFSYFRRCPVAYFGLKYYSCDMGCFSFSDFIGLISFNNNNISYLR